MASRRHPSSFRDPAGHIFVDSGTVYRQINEAGRADYDGLMESGLYDELVKDGLLVSHKEVSSPAGENGAYKIIKPQQIPFISYPYEWSFSQLKDAALLTLDIQKRALARGLILKDASAYNVQFIGTKPILIDSLSFKKYEPGEAWEGYRQFCEHFLAPLALAQYTSLQALRLLRVDLEGVPLDLACSLLPKKAKLKYGLLTHLYLHNSSQKKHQNDGAEQAGRVVKQRQVSTFALNGIVSSLENTINSLKVPGEKTEWGDYYTFTNYSDKAFKQKRKLVKQLLDAATPKPKTVWDLGANNGEFSSLAAEAGIQTVAFDIDPVAVDRNYHTTARQTDHMLPLLQDVVNPSPATGLMNRERDSLEQRGPADVVMALALIHHLAIGRNLPLSQIAELLAGLGKQVIIEFVPKGDSKVDILLASRRDVFPDYDETHFEAAMNEYFKLAKRVAIPGTKRSLYLYKRKESK